MVSSVEDDTEKKRTETTDSNEIILMNKTNKEVIEWHMETFPNATKQAVLNKLREECLELVAAIDGEYGHITEEIADVMIVSMAYVGRCKLRDLSDIIKFKLEINKNRAWGKETSDGDRPREK